MTNFETEEARTERPSDLTKESKGGIEEPNNSGEGDHSSAVTMDASVPEKPASLEGSQQDGVSPVADGTVDPKVERKSDIAENAVPPLSDLTFTQEREDLSLKDGQPQEREQEAAVVDKEGSALGLESDRKKEEELHAAEQIAEKSSNGTNLVQNKEEESREQRPGSAEGAPKMKERTEKKLRRPKEKKGKDVVTGEEGNKKETKKREDEDIKLKGKKEVDSHLKVDEKEEEKQKKKEKSKVDDVKKEKKDKSEKNGADISGQPEGEKKKEKKEKSEKNGADISGQPEGEKKKEKKEKKPKVTSERIQKKLEKIDAKIGRILAKKEDYVLRLKQAQEKEHQESEKAALQEREASTAVTGKSVNDRSDSGLRREESVILDEYRTHFGAGTVEEGDKNTDIGSGSRGLGSLGSSGSFGSGSLSRTVSVVPGPPQDEDEGVGQKDGVNDLPNVLKGNDSEWRHPFQVDPADTALKGDVGEWKHPFQLDSSDTATKDDVRKWKHPIQLEDSDPATKGDVSERKHPLQMEDSNTATKGDASDASESKHPFQMEDLDTALKDSGGVTNHVSQVADLKDSGIS